MTKLFQKKGLKSAIYTILLGPVFLSLMIWELGKTNKTYRYLAWAPLFLLLCCSFFALSLSLSPVWLGLIYFGLFTSLFLIFHLVKGTEKPEGDEKEKKRQNLNFSRAIGWMIFMSFIFTSLSSLVQIVNYWLFGEYVSVQFSSAQNNSATWGAIGMVIGFFYGVKEKSIFLSKDVSTLLKTTGIVLFLIAVYSVIILFFIKYPIELLTPISYEPQFSEYIFYFLIFLAITSSIYFFLRINMAITPIKTMLLSLFMIPCILIHCIILSGYATTVNLTVASIMEANGRLAKAFSIYAKTIPYIYHEPLQASMHHRHGVYQVMQGNYKRALSLFNKVVTDYSDSYGVYRKASKYIESFGKNTNQETRKQNILTVRHRTFEQAASCFPNSLAVIINFYEDDKLSTRDLSYSIKEGFDEGSFIWKADKYLANRGYTLITTYWQTKETLISLLNAEYPVLIYIPSHVYTLYGYDSFMDIFFTYDTAKSNRWDDKPFSDLQASWIKDSFLMSVVVKKGEEDKIKQIAPDLFYNTDAFTLLQKAQISNYYSSKSFFWRDYDQYELVDRMGYSGLTRSDHDLTIEGFNNYPWNEIVWNQRIFPVIEKSWAVEWPLFKRFILYMLYHKQVSRAQDLIRLFEKNLNEASEPVIDSFLSLKLLSELAADNRKEVLTISDKLIGIAEKGSRETDLYWGYFYKGKYLFDNENYKEAFELLIPLLNKIEFNPDRSNEPVRLTLELLADIVCRDYALSKGKEQTLKVAWIQYGIEPSCSIMDKDRIRRP